MGSDLSQGSQSNTRTVRKVALALNLNICEVGAAASYLAIRRGVLGGDRNHQLESEKEANRMGVADRDRTKRWKK